MTSCVELRQLSKRFHGFVAVQDLDLAIEDGSFVTLLGPSGCGKTTTLRMIAGLETITHGEIYIKGRRVNDVPVHKRNLGLVFQNYALFPHKTVFDNIAFGLKYRNVQREERHKRVSRALEIVRLPQLESRFPAQLSGGQQQRIALARAIVIEPDVLLLDEPLAALDANLREEMRVELKRIQRDLGITTIFVTHDQGEALAMSDRIVVMNDGAIEQAGAPEAVYNRPTSRFVARFLGHSNMLTGRVDGVEGQFARIGFDEDLQLRVLPAGTAKAQVTVIVRAEKVQLAESLDVRPDYNVLDGHVSAVDYQGQFARYFVTVAGQELQAINPIAGSPFREGTRVRVGIDARDCILLDG